MANPCPGDARKANPGTDVFGVIDPCQALPREVQDTSAALADRTNLSQVAFTQAWTDAFAHTPPDGLIIGQEAYLHTHKQRFHELFNAVAALTTPRARILEFGTSEATRLYRQIRPECTLVTADRPVAEGYIGFTADKSRALAKSNDHVAIDLESADTATHPGLERCRPYDLIVLTEVLEHLVTNPETLIAGLIGHLRAGGFLYLTTPNFLARANRRAIIQGRNPQPFYPGRDADWDRHHHFREYTMAELLAIADACGAEVHAAYYSGCWDPVADAELDTQPDLRGNLVMVLRRSTTPGGGEGAS